MNAEPPLTLRDVGTITGIVLSIITVLWTILYRVARPFVDDSRMQSLVRKSPEYERHLREVMFRADITERQRVRRLAIRALRTADKNGEAISRLVETQHAATMLLQSIPHMATTMESMADALEKMHAELKETNKLCIGYGQDIAAHAALLHAPGAGRRHDKRRVDDPAPSDFSEERHE